MKRNLHKAYSQWLSLTNFTRPSICAKLIQQVPIRFSKCFMDRNTYLNYSAIQVVVKWIFRNIVNFTSIKTLRFFIALFTVRINLTCIKATLYYYTSIYAHLTIRWHELLLKLDIRPPWGCKERITQQAVKPGKDIGYQPVNQRCKWRTVSHFNHVQSLLSRK